MVLTRTLMLLLLATLLATAADGPALDSLKSQADLDKALAALDAAMFDSYNKCDIAKFASFFSDDVEFYHDQSGLEVGVAKLTESLKQNICGKVQRELVSGSLQTHRMKNFGAVQLGVHRFLHPGREKEDGVGEASFVHLWRYKDGGWKITRVISYDHHPEGK